MKTDEVTLPLEEEIVDIADFFKVFGDPTRLKILFLLEQGERGVNSICEELGMQQSTISQQLKLLRARRLVRYRKDGRNVLYRLNDEHIHAILALGIEHYQELNSVLNTGCVLFQRIPQSFRLPPADLFDREDRLVLVPSSR